MLLVARTIAYALVCMVMYLSCAYACAMPMGGGTIDAREHRRRAGAWAYEFLSWHVPSDESLIIGRQTEEQWQQEPYSLYINLMIHI